MTLGRLNKRKGQDLIIEVLGQIKDDYNIKYFIVGRGEEKEYCSISNVESTCD